MDAGGRFGAHLLSDIAEAAQLRGLSHLCHLFGNKACWFVHHHI